MAQDRVVKVTLTAQMQNYLAGMEKARKVTAETASEATKLELTKKNFDRLGKASLALGGALATGLAVAVKRAADFDQAMSNVAATGEDARNNLESLRQAAIDAGASTVFSAEESANAIENLAKAGLSASDILGGALKGSLDLAAAGGLGVAEAGEIAATTLQQFGLAGSEAVHVADLLAAGAGKAMGDVGDMAQALKQAGLVANQFGIPVEEATGALAAFANQGLLGSDAGTSLRTMLLRLANPTEEVKDLMSELGIEAYNSSGQFVGLQGLAGELEESLAGMTDEQRQATLAMIFGQDAIRAATILYDEGADGIEAWTEKVDDAGYAAETAETKLDNLAGDFEALSGAVDSALITMGSAAQGPLRAFVQALTELVDGFNNMPASAQQAVFWVGAVAAAGATALGSYLLLVPKVAEFKAALDVLGPSAQRAARGVGALARVGAIGVTIGAAAIGVEWLANEISKNLLPSTEQVDNRMRSAKSGVELFAAALYKEGITNTRQASDLLGSLGRQLDAVADSDFWNQASISGTAVTVIKEIAETAKTDLPAAQAAFQRLAEDGNLTDRQMRTLIKTVPELQNVLLTYADTSEGAADAQDLLNILMDDGAEKSRENESALRALAGQASDTESEVEGLADTIRNFGQATLDTRDAQRQFEQALDDLTASVAEHGATLDIDTDAGRANEAALDDIAESALDLAAALYEQTGSQDDATAAVKRGRDELIEALKQFGITGQAAEDYADELGLIPGNVSTYIDLQSQTAMNRLQAFKDAFNALPSYKGVTLETITGNPSMGGGVLPGRAGGGAIYGPGPTGVDSVPILAAPGEHMLTAADVAAMGGQNAVYAFRSALHGGGGTAVASATQQGPAVFNLYDADNVLIGTMRGEIAASNAAQARMDNAGVRRRFG